MGTCTRRKKISLERSDDNAGVGDTSKKAHTCQGESGNLRKEVAYIGGSTAEGAVRLSGSG